MKPRAMPSNTEDLTRWYQVPLLWMSIGLFLLILAGCGHLILVSLEIDKAHPANTKPAGTLVFGIPLTRNNSDASAFTTSDDPEHKHSAETNSADIYPANTH